MHCCKSPLFRCSSASSMRLRIFQPDGRKGFTTTMTAHKSFKKLVRTRMRKTGESYTTAWRKGEAVDPPALP